MEPLYGQTGKGASQRLPGHVGEGVQVSWEVHLAIGSAPGVDGKGTSLTTAAGEEN